MTYTWQPYDDSLLDNWSLFQATRSGRRVGGQPVRVQAAPVPRRTGTAARPGRSRALVRTGRAQRCQGIYAIVKHQSLTPKSKMVIHI